MLDSNDQYFRFFWIGLFLQYRAERYLNILDTCLRKIYQIQRLIIHSYMKTFSASFTDLLC